MHTAILDILLVVISLAVITIHMLMTLATEIQAYRKHVKARRLSQERPHRAITLIRPPIRRDNNIYPAVKAPATIPCTDCPLTQIWRRPAIVF